MLLATKVNLNHFPIICFCAAFRAESAIEPMSVSRARIRLPHSNNLTIKAMDETSLLDLRAVSGFGRGEEVLRCSDRHMGIALTGEARAC